MSVESQNIERSLAAALWKQLCDEIEQECRSVNSVDRHRMVVERKPLDISVTDMNTRKLLRLSFQENGPSINCRQTAKSDANIGFRADPASTSSLALMHCGISQSPQALAVSLMIGLTRF